MENRKIILLDENTINQIAAGEVIEKPASIVKELVENSIDALATKISISIKDGGLKKIKVVDNGRGLPESEFSKVFKRYATSKLLTIDDLYTLKTMGFRGEALASIAAVSKVAFASKTPEAVVGSKVVIEGGLKTGEVKEAMQNGTTVIVTDIFFNTPVRQKFLNSIFKETRDIVAIVEKLILSRSDIKMELFIDGCLLLKSKGDGNLRELASLIFSLQTAKEMEYVSGEKDGVGVKALIGGVNQYRGNKNQIIFFINNRYVISRRLSKYFIEAYHNSLPINRFPIGIIYLEVPPYTLEVNIHPRKMEVKIDGEKELGEFLKSLVLKKLHNKKGEFFYEKEEIKEAPFNFVEFKEKTLEGAVEEEVLYRAEKEEAREGYIRENFFKEEAANPFNDIEIYGAFKNTYILAGLKDQLLIFDQHAAHERINFEKALVEFAEKGFKTQHLLEGIIVNLSSGDFLKVIGHIDKIINYGVVLEEFGINTFIIRGLPLGIGGEAAGKDFLINLVDKIEEQKDDSIKDYMIEKASCARSIKAGEKINREELYSLIYELGKCKYPFTCPHGRPIFLKYGLKDLEKLFLRS